MIALLLAMLAMGVRDCVSTLLVVAEARGRATLAGALDAGNDLAGILVTLAGAGTIIRYGWNGHTILILAAMMTVSFFGTRLWVRLAGRLTQPEAAK